MATDLLQASAAWFPGSFTKNFRWRQSPGLKRLYDNICVGFDNTLQPVPRDEYHARVGGNEANKFIPTNFFLYNEIRDGENFIGVDELVFQALTAPHSERFDQLALFALHLSHAGRWRGQKEGQRYPALWATSYVLNRISREFGWDTSLISANDIEAFLRNLPQFTARTSYHKIATNLAFLYSWGGLKAFATTRVERWWVDALFLTLDRTLADRKVDGLATSSEVYPEVLLKSHFVPLSGKVSAEKTFAVAHLVSLYSICGGNERFDPRAVQELVSVALPNYQAHLDNDYRPQGAMHPTNPRILKSIPRECADLAKVAGFEIVLADELNLFDPDEFVRRRANEAVDGLRRDNIRPTMTAEELHKITRGE